jgi:hypothetical protein
MLTPTIDSMSAGHRVENDLRGFRLLDLSLRVEAREQLTYTHV